MFLQLFVKRADLFLCLLGLCSLQLIDISDKGVLLCLLCTLIRYALFDDHFEVAVEKIEPRYTIPWLKCISGEDDNFVLA